MEYGRELNVIVKRGWIIQAWTGEDESSIDKRRVRAVRHKVIAIVL